MPTTGCLKLLEIIERHDSCLFSKFQVIQHFAGLLSGEIHIHQSYANKHRKFASPQRNSNFLFLPQECLGEIMDTIGLFMSRPCPGDFCLIRTFSFFLSILNGTKLRKRLGIECRERKYRKPRITMFSQLFRTQVHVVVSVKFFLTVVLPTVDRYSWVLVKCPNHHIWLRRLIRYGAGS